MKTKAIFFNGNNKSLVEEIKIKDPEYDEIQAKTLINGICMWEVLLYKLEKPPSFFSLDYLDKYIGAPKGCVIPGHEGIGTVTKVGKAVKDISIGDYVTTREWSEYTNQKINTFAKIDIEREDISNYIIEPLSCAVTASFFINFYPGDKVIIFGAGYMGLLLIQLLSSYPLTELVVVDIKENNLNLAKEFGATKIINYKDPDGMKILKNYSDGYFDVSYEASGNKEVVDWLTKLTNPGGKIGMYSWIHEKTAVDLNLWHIKGLHVLNVSPTITINEDSLRKFKAAIKLINYKKISQEKLITHKYKIEEIEKAMKESTERKGNFIKSILIF